ncbi:MAG TPA: lipid-A-disaccharide synthase N-terminal domain-containing protein [Gammaproteobacteria bacterium]
MTLHYHSVWLAIGFTGQLMFAARFIVQWLVSEKRRRSVIPATFWYLSIGGGIVLLLYAIHQRDPVFIAGQATGVLIYGRNLMLLRDGVSAGRASGRLSEESQRRPRSATSSR